MRLRALRVEVDVKLFGRIRDRTAADRLRTKVPMDTATAQSRFFHLEPGPGYLPSHRKVTDTEIAGRCSPATIGQVQPCGTSMTIFGGAETCRFACSAGNCSVSKMIWKRSNSCASCSSIPPWRVPSSTRRYGPRPRGLPAIMNLLC
jgi:hypothetical protein